MILIYQYYRVVKVLMMSLALLGSAALAQTHAHDHALRLVVSDGKTHTLQVLDVQEGRTLASFGTPGRLSGLETGPGGRYAYALHRDDHRVTVLDSGLKTVSHGDHDDLQVGVPYVLATLNTGQKPTHFVVSGEHINVFNDGDGTVAIFTEDLLGKTNDMNIVKVTQPDHGAPLLVGDVLLSGQLSLNRADAYDVKTGKLLGPLPTCTALHGGGIVGQTAFFGCKEGVQVVNVSGKTLRARMIPNPPGTPEGTRVGMFTHSDAPFLYADFGKGVARLTPDATRLTPTALSGKPRAFEVTEDGKTLVVLTNDGQLHTLDAASGRLLKSARVVASFEAGEKAGVRPDLALLEGLVYVTSPDTGEVLEVRPQDLKVVRRLQVGGTPSFITPTFAHGVRH